MGPPEGSTGTSRAPASVYWKGGSCPAGWQLPMTLQGWEHSQWIVVPKYRRPLMPSGPRSLAKLITSFSLISCVTGRTHSLPQDGQKFSRSHIQVITAMPLMQAPTHLSRRRAATLPQPVTDITVSAYDELTPVCLLSSSLRCGQCDASGTWFGKGGSTRRAIEQAAWPQKTPA